MNPRKKNKIKPKYILFFLVIICCILIGISMNTNDSENFVQKGLSSVIVPMQKGINSIGTWISSKVENAKTIEELSNTNDELTSEIELLQSQIYALQNNQAELDSLRELLKLKEKFGDYNTVGARVIAKDSGNWYKTFTIDKGSNDKIAVDMNVIAQNGLVGIVTEVGDNYAKVRSIIDDSSSISSMNLKSSDLCIVYGDLQLLEQGLLGIELISTNSDFAEGDEIVTSYVSDKFLPGIAIGYVTNIEKDSTGLTMHANLVPIVDFEHINNVLVITDLKSDFVSDNAAESESESETETGQ